MTPKFRKLIIFLIVLSISSLACGAVTRTPAAFPTLEQPTSTPLPDTPDQNQGFNVQTHQDQLTSLYEQANPGVVAIRVLSEEGA